MTDFGYLYLDTSFLPCTFNKILKSTLLPVKASKIAEWMINSVDPDQMPHSAYCMQEM